MKVVIFGIGQFLKVRKHCFCDDEVVAYIDNNEEMQGTEIDGIPVLKPNRIVTLKYDAICIMAGYKSSLQMKHQLIEMGIPISCIYTFKDYFSSRKKKNIMFLGKSDTFNNEVAMFLPSLENTGGFRAALYALKILLKKFKRLTVVSPCGGNAKKEIEKLEIDIIITSDVSKNNDILWNILNNTRIIFLNGLYYSYLIPYVNKPNKEIIWWIHSGLSFYDVYPLPNKHFKTRPVKVFGVSESVRKAYLSQNTEGYMEILPFGIPDQKNNCKILTKENKLIFAVIGSIVRLKGIDLVIEAIKKLSKSERLMLEVWFIGAEVNETYSSEVHKASENMTELKWKGKKNHADVIDLFQQIDVVISASREDMLPMVTIEAMMNEKVCIISDNVGTAFFVEHKKNGLIFKKENVDELANRIYWCLNNKDKLSAIGKEARKLYETEFCESIFEERLLKAIEEKNEKNFVSNVS